jgi:hypothetical protein
MAMVGVVAPCCVMVRVVAWLQWVSSCRVVSWSGLLCSHGGCHRAAWDHGDWTAKEEISRKKRKEKKKKVLEGILVRVAWQCSPCISHRHIIVVDDGAMVHPGG